MKRESIQHALNDTIATSNILARLRSLAGEIVIDQGRIQQLGDRASIQQIGHWDNVRVCRVPVAKAIRALEEANRHLFKVAVTLRQGEMDGEGVADAPDLTSTGKPLPIDPDASNEGEEWKG